MDNKDYIKSFSNQKLSKVRDKRWERIWYERASKYKSSIKELDKSPKSLRKSILLLKMKLHKLLNEKSLFKYWSFIRNIHLVIPKYLNVILMIIIFFSNPKILFKFSWRKCLPPEKMKDKYADNLIDLYNPKVKGNFNFSNCNRKIFMRGYEDIIPKGKNIILVNSEITNENKHCIFVSADEKTFNYYLENDVQCIFIKVINVNSKGEKKTLSSIERIKNKKFKMLTLLIRTNNNLVPNPRSSGILSIITFATISSNLKVYGWNFYQTKRLSKMNFFEFIWNIFFFINDYHTKVHVEYSLTHLFYAYYFDKLKNLKVEGNLDYFKNNLYNKIITPRLNSIFLN